MANHAWSTSILCSSSLGRHPAAIGRSAQIPGCLVYACWMSGNWVSGCGNWLLLRLVVIYLSVFVSASIMDNVLHCFVVCRCRAWLSHSGKALADESSTMGFRDRTSVSDSVKRLSQLLGSTIGDRTSHLDPNMPSLALLQCRERCWHDDEETKGPYFHSDRNERKLGTQPQREETGNPATRSR